MSDDVDDLNDELDGLTPAELAALIPSGPFRVRTRAPRGPRRKDLDLEKLTPAELAALIPRHGF